jgi:hypothetical protein
MGSNETNFLFLDAKENQKNPLGLHDIPSNDAVMDVWRRT